MAGSGAWTKKQGIDDSPQRPLGAVTKSEGCLPSGINPLAKVGQWQNSFITRRRLFADASTSK